MSQIDCSRPLMILGTGHVVPEKILTSHELDQRLGYRQGKIQKISGVKKRHVTSYNETAAILATRAAQQALDFAQLTVADIDCVVAVSATMDQGMPCNAALIHKELGLGDSGVPAFDINASCLGFLAALDTLSWQLAAGGAYQHILIVASDLASCGLNWEHLESSAIFGDGGAAVILGRPNNGSHARILASSLKTYSTGAHFCEIPGGGSRYHPVRIEKDVLPLMKFKMNGKKVFQLAAKHMPAFVEDLLKDANLNINEVDWIVPHQASHLGLEHMTVRLGLDKGKVVNIYSEYANQVAASLPTALDIAIRDGRIQRGQRILLLGTGAGLSIGGVILEY